MVENESGTLTAVAWREICPWLVIFRTFRLALSLRVLLLAAVAIFLTLCGWWVLARGLLGEEQAGAWMGTGADNPLEAVTQAVEDRPAMPKLSNPMKADRLAPTAWEALDPFFGSWAHLSRPIWEARNLEVKPSALACLLLCGLWSLAVWAFFGGAITRIAAVQLAADERVGWAAAIRHAGSKWLSYVCAPLYLVVALVCAALPVFLVSLILMHFDVGVFLAALIWPLGLLAGLVMTVLLLGLIFGWPLMWTSVSAEGTDSFGALSNSFAYTFGRPLHYLFYAIVAAVFGALGWLLVKNVAAGIIWLTYWAASCGCGADRIKLIMPGGAEPEGVLYAGAVVIRFWTGCVKLLAVGFLYGYFWTAMTAIYFLLRRDVDATEMDEVFLDEDASEQTYGLPPLKLDEAGAPIVPADAGPQSGEADVDDVEPQEEE